MAETCLELKKIKKSFSKDETVLKEISLSIGKGEFITLLESSGCGKTTTLRIIAGLETPDSGQVFLDGKDVTDLAPEARDVNHSISELRPVSAYDRCRQHRLRTET